MGGSTSRPGLTDSRACISDLAVMRFHGICQMKKMMSVAAVAAMMMFAGAASAQKAYVGGTIGFSNFSVDCPSLAECDTSDTAFKIYGGYTLAPHISIEGAYIDFGSTNVTNFGVNTGSIDVSAFVVNGAYHWDFSPKWSGVARLGLASVSSDPAGIRFVGVGSDSSIKLYAGVGIGYAVAKNFKIVGAFDLTSFEVGNSDGSLNALSGGIQFSF